jgi:hypothetical protein
LPLPVAPAVTESHEALLVDVQAQPIAAVTATLPLVAPDKTLADTGAIVGAHAAPVWLTVKVLPPTVKVPVRTVTAGFAVKL